MSRANSKKPSGPDQRSTYAGATSRIRRGAGSSQVGRRSALMSVLNSMYTNTNSSRDSATTANESRNQNSANDR